MSSSSKSSRDYSQKHRKAILEPWRQSHNLPPSLPFPSPKGRPPTSPISTNFFSSSLPPQNLTHNHREQNLNELHHLSNLFDINLQQEIEATNPSPPTSPCAVDPTLFTQKEGKDILLMSMMGKMSFFLRLQISQSPRGIFLNQSKYALEIIKKYGMETSDPVDTPMVEKSKLDEDPQGKAVDPTRYRGMISSLMYLTSRTINMGLWYSKDSYIALTAFADADHAGCQDTRRSTSGSMQILGDRLVSCSSKILKSTAISNIEAEYIALSRCCAQIL
ncbi:hypothetical protein Tco_1044896 [Tanacetum coccineum]|uniref:Reverse transcriptase Ty1/copia-type domain-containing protein n=1 Tax=Tanacetum coccineum TaxID=301880 RepID=A0ABQ5GR75_9ASTR